MGRHIVSAFDNDLKALGAQIAEMGGLAEAQLRLALEAMQNRDFDATLRVIASDKLLDQKEQEIESRSVDIIALRQPMASDLREVIAALKVASTLERIGDLAKNIAKRNRIIAEQRQLPVAGGLVRMGEMALRQLADVLNAYAGRDAELAVQVWKNDIQIDEYYNSLFREILTYMMEDPRAISVGAELMFVAKNIERIGDHTTFISEMTHYVVTGKVLGDDRPKGAPAGMLDPDKV